MTSTASFELLQQLAEKRRDECAARLGKAITDLNGAQQQLQVLNSYLGDYARKLQEASVRGIEGGGLRNYQTFLANLEKAIAQQGVTVQQLDAVVNRVRLELAQEQRQVESFTVMLRRQAEALAVRDNRRQQSAQDEFATNSALRKAADTDNGNGS